MARELDEELLFGALMGTPKAPGVFERVVGHGTGTTAYKGVHLMGDLAQRAVGGVPDHRGELMARVIREHKSANGEDNSDPTLRRHPKLGAAYDRAFPASLGHTERARLREALGEVFNYDGGVYGPTDAMASGLATHRALLGADGFHRFGIGGLVAHMLGPVGLEELARLYDQRSDPISRLLEPLLLDGPLVAAHAHQTSGARTPFEERAGERLRALLRHPLSKTTRLRALLLGVTLTLALRLLGLGRQGGRPVVLATVADPDQPRGGALREGATRSFKAGVDRLDEVFAGQLIADPLVREAWEAPPVISARAIRLADAPDTLEEAGPALVRAARAHKWAKEVYWPDQFIVSLGRRAGCVLPLKDQAGWGKRLALSADLVEVLVLMFTDPAGQSKPWVELWQQVREEFGLLIGVDEHRDAIALEEVEVPWVPLEGLAQNSELALEVAVRRGLARRLPDSGAEAGAGTV